MIRQVMTEILNTHYSTIITVIYGLAALALIHAAITDLKRRIIKNEVSIFITAMFILLAAVNFGSGQSFTSSTVIPVVTALIVFLLTSGLFALRMMGGGDVKLMSSFALFAGLQYTLPFLLYTTVCGGIVALGTLFFYRFQENESQPQRLATVDMSSDLYLASVAQTVNGETTSIFNENTESETGSAAPQRSPVKVPYGLAISTVGLWVLFQLFIQTSGK